MPSSPRAVPRRLGGERLVLAEHLDEAPHVARQRLCGQNLDPVAGAASEHLDDEVVREAGKRAAGVGHVHRMDLVLVVEDRVHHVDRELELVDAAARARRVELRVVALGLLVVVAPVVARPAEDVLGPRRGLGAAAPPGRRR